MWCNRRTFAVAGLASIVFSSCSSSGTNECRLAQIAAGFKAHEPVVLLPYAKVSAPAMTRFSDGSLYFLSSGNTKDVLLQLDSPSLGQGGGTTSMRAAAVEVLPAKESGSLVLHVFGREEDAMQATWDVTEVFLHPKVCIETRAELK